MPNHKAFIILPNQLFANINILQQYDKVFLIEEPTCFYDPIYKPFRVNKVKIAYLRACMKHYQIHTLRTIKSQYLEYNYMKNNKYSIFKDYDTITMYDPIDIDVIKKYKEILGPYNTLVHILDSPDMLLPNATLLEGYFLKHNNTMRHLSFFKFVREKLHILEGVKSFDKMNRSPPPKVSPHVYKYKPPRGTLKYYNEAIEYANTNFVEHYGDASNVLYYPISHLDSIKAFDVFLKIRLPQFGKYEDAIMKEDPFMYHSVISPLLNIGLLTSRQIIDRLLNYYSKNSKDIPMSSLEGFVRQVVGWRCMMQSLYIFKHEDLIKSNLPKNKKRFKNMKLWYDGETGILPLDQEIKKARDIGYAHHIVRLMVFMNFFILCELHPSEIYKWFMEVVSIDAYSWVMISNVYAMGYFYPKVMSKPYISTSNYIVKMTNYKKDGHWDKVWDALYHDFLRHKPSEYTFFYKRTFKDDTTQEQLAKEFKAKHFIDM
jgi:deoxyribodipyrimidine photolyase-related protein